MRISSSITSLSWIPSEAIPGAMKIPMLLGIGHYDPPPPDHLEDLDGLHAAGKFRFANRLSAFAEFADDGGVTDAGYAGGGLISPTVATLGQKAFSIPPIGFPDLQHPPEIGDGSVRFVQTTGGRTGAPMPRKVNRPPFVQVTSPTVWTTLALTLHTDGRVETEVVGASPFPRHWFYDKDGLLFKKSGVADYKGWAEDNFGDRSPWADHEQAILTADVETALERHLSTVIMSGGARPEIRRLSAGAILTEQGQPGDELYLLLDGILSVEVNGECVVEIGPGAVLGERAILEGGRRTSTLRANTPIRVAVADVGRIDRNALEQLAQGHGGGKTTAEPDSPVA